MDGAMVQVATALVASGVTGLVSTWATVRSLRVHIHYLNEKIERVDSQAKRAHERIDLFSAPPA